jgi:hypothetical protein
MSISKYIENIYGFNPNKMCYDISFENNKFLFSLLIFIALLFDCEFIT